MYYKLYAYFFLQIISIHSDINLKETNTLKEHLDVQVYTPLQKKFTQIELSQSYEIWRADVI